MFVPALNIFFIAAAVDVVSLWAVFHVGVSGDHEKIIILFYLVTIFL